MHGVGAAQTASGTIDIGQLDSQGNWPLQVKVSHLPSPPKNGYYEMFLTRHGKIAATCGTFNVHGSTATVRLNAPYNLGALRRLGRDPGAAGNNGHRCHAHDLDVGEQAVERPGIRVELERIHQ